MEKKKIKSNWNEKQNRLLGPMMKHSHTHTHTHELKKNFPFVFYSILFYSLFVNCLWVQLCSSFVIEKQQPISLCACLSFGVCACVCVCINKF